MNALYELEVAVLEDQLDLADEFFAKVEVIVRRLEAKEVRRAARRAHNAHVPLAE